MKTWTAVFLCVFALGMTVQAQPVVFKKNQVVLASGDLKFLKGAKQLLIEYNYDNMMVGTMKEADYIVKHSGEMNTAKPGSGNEWKERWVKDRKERFEPNFEKQFIKTVAKSGITAGTNVTGAQYKLIIKTVVTEPGLYTGVKYAEKPTYIDVEAIFVDVNNPENVLCKILCNKVIGEAAVSFANLDIGTRISAAYTNCGLLLGNFINKTLKKS